MGERPSPEKNLHHYVRIENFDLRDTIYLLAVSGTNVCVLEECEPSILFDISSTSDKMNLFNAVNHMGI